MLRKGVEIAVISKRLGHSDTLITENLYIHLVPSDQTTVIKQIEYRSRNALNIWGCLKMVKILSSASIFFVQIKNSLIFCGSLIRIFSKSKKNCTKKLENLISLKV